jgi:hypothetical protein
MASYQVNPLEILDTTNSTGVGSGGSLTVGGGVAIGSDLYVGGNIAVSGTTTSFADNILILNAGATTSQDTGILLNRASSDISGITSANYSSIIYSETTDEFRFGYASSDTRGTLTINNYIPIHTGGVTVESDTNIANTVNNYSTTSGALNVSGEIVMSSNPILFTTPGGNPPSVSTRSTGTKIVLYPQVGANSGDYSMGIEPSYTWFQVPSVYTGYKFYQGTSSSLIISTSGNVGIGTTSPTQILDVNGTTRIGGDLNIFGNMTVTGALTYLDLSYQTSSNILTTNLTTTNLLHTSSTVDNIIVTANATITNLKVSGTSDFGTAIVATSISTGQFNALNITSGTIRAATLVTSANISMSLGTANNLFVNTLFSSANIANTNFTSVNSRFTNITSTSVIATTGMTTATLFASTGVTTPSARVTNMVVTNVTSTNIIASTIGSAVYTGGSMSLSGSLTVAGTITSSNTTQVNYIVTSTSTDSLLVTETMSAIGNSNTIGNIITTGGNVGIGTSMPSYLLDVGGDARYTGTVTMGNLEVVTLGDINNFTNTNATITNLFNTLITTGTLRANTVLLTPLITSASAILTNLSNTAITSATIRASTLITTANVSTALATANNLVVNTLLTSANIINTSLTNTNLLTTNISTTSLIGSNINALTSITTTNLFVSSNINTTNLNLTNITTSTIIGTTIASAVFTGGSMSLSGDLTVAGSFVSTSTTNANYVNTNTTTDTLIVTTRMSAVGNTNTIGSIITTGGNVGIGTVTPSYLLDVNGNARYTGSVTMANLKVTTTGDIATITNSNLLNTNITTGTIRVNTLATMGQLATLNMTAGNIRANISISTGQLSILNVTAGTVRVTTLVSSSNIGVVNITSGSIIALTGVTTPSLFVSTGVTTATLLATDVVRFASTVAVANTVNNYSATSGSVNLSGDIIIDGDDLMFTTTGVAAPTMDGRNAGTKLILYPSTGVTQGDYAIGIEPNYMWFQTPTITSTGYKFYQGTTQSLIMSTDGNVGIGDGIQPAYQLELSSDSAAKPSTNTWTVSSDERLKTNIELANLDMCYNTIKSIPLKRYTWRDDVYTSEQVPDRSKLGWIAQDVEQVIPKAVEQRNMLGYSDCRTLNSDQLIASLYGCVQKLMLTVEQLQTEVDILKGDESVRVFSQPHQPQPQPPQPPQQTLQAINPRTPLRRVRNTLKVLF